MLSVIQVPYKRVTLALRIQDTLWNASCIDFIAENIRPKVEHFCDTDLINVKKTDKNPNF